MFTGVIISPGKLKIASDMTINGIVIAGNEKDGGAASRADIREGRCAGIQVSEGAHVTFKYDINDPATKNNDRDLIFKIRFMDKSLQRKLYDCLKMTNYGSASGDMDFILGANLPEMLADDLVPKPKVKLSKESVISSQQEGLQFVIKSLKKIEN